MESSSPSSNVTDVPGHRWAKFLGTAVAVLTLVMPLVAIAYDSVNDTSTSPALIYSPPRRH